MPMGPLCRVLATLVSLALTAVAVHGDEFIGPKASEVFELPGWFESLPSRQFSGFVASNPAETHFLHYHLVLSERDPANDPLVVWYSGGPGASSLYGYFGELGPFRLSDLSFQTLAYNLTGIPSLFYNEFGWHKSSNVMFVEFPAPVGFSFCGTASAPIDSCPMWNDTSSAVENYHFLHRFLIHEFPELRTNPLYVSGESYAGVYVPMLVEEILRHGNELGLVGFAIGDGCMGKDVYCGADKPYYQVEFMHRSGQYEGPLYAQILEVCGVASLKSGTYSKVAGCKELLARMTAQIGGYYSYNIYDTCYDGADSDAGGVGQLEFRRALPVRSVDPDWRAKLPADFEDRISVPTRSFQHSAGGGAGPNDYPCGTMKAFKAYLGLDVVRRALNMPVDANFYSGDNGWPGYTVSYPNLLPWYNRVTRANPDLRILIYSGDVDPAVVYFFSEEWVRGLDLPVKEPWRPWTMDGKIRMGGHVTQYRDNVTFVTVRGSGHMVPLYAPEKAFHMFSTWVDDKEWPRYDPPTHKLVYGSLP